MSRRKNKKLMVGLGSTLIFSSTAIMGAFGLKSIVDNFTNQANNLADQINSANFRNVDEIPDFNLVKESEIGDWSSMLFDTSKYAKQMHFGSTEKGQTLTPWGWLGAGSSAGSGSSRDYYPTTVFLTSWNGEILWVNDEFKNLGEEIGSKSPKKNHVYDLKYDWNTDTVFVLRTIAKNGLLEEGQTKNVMPARIDVLKGSTGEKILTIDNDQLFSFRETALKTLKNNKLFYNGPKAKERMNNLYSLDIASSSGIDSRVYLTYKPNFFKLIDKEATDPVNNRRNLIWMHRILEYWDKLQITFEINPVTKTWKKVDAAFGGDNKGLLINEGSSEAWRYKYENKEYQMGDTSLIANPFNTVSNFGHLITHLFFADNDGNIYHLYYANKNTGDSSRDWNNYTGIEKLADGKDKTKTDVPGVLFSILNDSENTPDGGYWADAIRWDNDIFSTANLVVNRNMFDTNSVTFAYPYGASLDHSDQENVPAFNVASLMIDFTSGKIKPANATDYKANFLKSATYDFGKQSYEHWKANKDKYNDANQSHGIAKIYPWPNSTNDGNWQLRFNRLISVSPFDNTIIFAGMAPFRPTVSIIDPDRNKGEYASFWAGTTQLTNGTKPYMRPFIISNDSTLGGELNGSMINGSNRADRLKNLYQKGFTFDLSSLNSIDNNNFTANFNIYFSQTAQPREFAKYKDDNGKETNGVIPISKIGLIDNPFKDPDDQGSGEKYGWTTDITNLYGNQQSLTRYVKVINPEKFSSVIHSRARVDQWLKRSWFNINNGANTLKAGTSVSPVYTNDNHAAIYQWNKNLKNSVFKTNSGAELLTNWQTGNKGGNFSLLEIPQGFLEVVNKSETDKLFLQLRFTPNNGRANKYRNIFYDKDKDFNRLAWKKEFTVEMPSVQYFTSWGSQIKAEGVTSTVENFSIVDNWEEPRPGDEWIDARKSPDKAVFGKSHNALSVNNRRPLRTVLRIKNPASDPKSKPAWWTPDDGFFNWYPVDTREILKGETEFKTVLQKFVEWKVKNIDLSEAVTKTGAFGLANITIEAGLQLNPAMFENATTTNVPIYKVNDTKYVAVANFQLNGKTVPKFLIYDDQYKDSRAIYKQEKTDYNNIYKGGFGEDVFEELKQSWNPDRLTSEKSSRLIISSDVKLLQNKLVRPNDQYNKPVIKAKYIDTTKTKLTIEPADDSVKDWFNNIFNAYNIALNLFAKFQYKLKDSNDWKTFDLEINDTDKASTGWTFDTKANEQIEQVRFRLVKSKTQDSYQSPEKDYVEWKNFDKDKDFPSLISDPAYVQGIPINFQSSWMTSQTISIANGGTLDTLSTTDLTSFEEKVLQQVVDNNNKNNALKEVLEFTYSIGNNEPNLTKDKFVNNISELLHKYDASDGGIFSLWNGNSNNNNSTAYKVNVRIHVKKANQKDYILSENNTEHPNGIAAAVKSDIKTKVDLTNYLGWLKNEKLNATKSTTAGQMSNVQIQSAKLQNGVQFDKKTFEEMSKILANVGIKFQFKQWDEKTKTWETTWKDDLKQIIKYNIADPKIMIGLSVNTTDFNIKVLNENQEIPNNNWTGIEVALNLPKTVTVDLDKLKKALENAITGDTHNIDVSKTEATINSAIEQIIQDNEAGGQTGLFKNLKDQLKFSFSLASSGFKSFNDLKTTVDKWANDQSEQTNNELKVKIELTDQSNSKEFEFSNNQDPETTIHDNENTVIKKWLFGKEYEKEIPNIIIDPTSNKNDIKYTFPTVFDEIRTGKKTYLKLEWKDATKSTFADAAANEWKDITKEELPTDVSDGKIQKIQIRVADANDQDQYIYGPQQDNSRQVKEINFTNLSVLVEVNPNWFTEIAIIENDADATTIKQLKLEHISQWEQKVLSKISVKDSQVINQIEIQYQFIDNNWKSKGELITKIQDELTKPSTTDREILQLWNGDKNNNDGIKIKAKFALKNQNKEIVFVDDAKKPITDDTKLTGDVNSQKIYTEVNLINYLDLLMKTEIDVEPKTLRDPNATPNIVEINGIKLPNNTNEGLFKHKTWVEISKALTAKKIKILFSKDKAAWYEPENITSYDANAGILWMAIENNASNLYVQYQQGQQPIAPLKDNKANPLFIRLNVQKVLNIEYSDFESLIQKPEISGNTKNLKFDNNNKIIQNIQTTIQKIKEKNKQNTGNPDYDRVPLVLKFSLGNSGWHSINDLKGFLARQTQDQDTRILKAKFLIEGTEQEQKNWILGGQTEFDLLPESNNPLKIYIHDQGIYNELTNAQLSGDNTNLTWTWAKLNVDPASGIITKPDKKSTLKVEYSLDKNTWTTTQTKSFNVGTQEMWIRLVLADKNRYEYETPTNIEKEIKIDLSKIKQILDVASVGIDTTDFVDANMDISNLNSLNTFNKWEDKVRNILKPTSANPPADWQKLIQFEYQLDVWSNTKHWADANTFLSELKQYQQNQSGDTLGILQLWNGTSGHKVSVRLKLANPQNNINYELRVDSKKPEEVPKVLKTEKIITTIDFKEVYLWLKDIKLNIDRTDTNTFKKMHWDKISAVGSRFNNKSWDDAIRILNKLNVEIQYRDFTKDNKPKQWVNDYNRLNSFGSNADFQMKFILKANGAKNIKFKLSDKETVEGSTSARESKEFNVQLKAPKFINLDTKVIDQFKTQKVFSGDTKNLQADRAKITQLIQDLKNANSNITNVNNAHLKVYFALGKTPGNEKSNWFEIQDFIDKLAEDKFNQASNQINMRFFVANTDLNNPEFITDNKMIVFKDHTNPEQVQSTNNNELMYYINDAQWESDLAKISVSGSTQELVWNFNHLAYQLETDQTVLITNTTANHKGLHLEWTAAENADLNAPSATQNDLKQGWTKAQPKDIAADIKTLWIRVVAQNGFIYGPAQNKKNQKHQIDLSNIHRIVKLQSLWLNDIVATGNLAQLKLNEDKAKQKLVDAKVLPPDEIDNLVFEYTIDEKEWSTREKFEQLITKKQGSGASGFILRREELKMRFGLKAGIAPNKYGFEIDGKIVNTEDDFKKHYKQLIDDGRNINSSVFGIINMNFVEAFSISNFIILGTNNIPRLKILNQEKMLNAFNPYASDHIFSLEITTTFDQTKNEWDWTKKAEIWNGQSFETNLAKFGLTINSDKKAALRLVIKTDKYGVFGDQNTLSLARANQNQNTSKAFQKLLDLSSNIYITVEIENPFEQQGKGLAIQTRDQNKKAKWKQGEGQFRIVVGDKNNGTPDTSDQDAQAFIDASTVANKEKLELVYKVFESKPSATEIKQFQRPEVINDYTNPLGWKIFTSKKDPTDQKEWSDGLNLKVGNYVMVALRVKKEFADPKNNPHILKGEKHSVLIPVQGTQTPGRIAGYLVDPADAPIKKETIHLESMKDNLVGYLDGYTQLKSLALEKDEKGTIEGIELKLQLYNDFHRDQNGDILVSGSGAKLVKRTEQGMEKGAQYTDKNGGLINDKDGNGVFAYTDPQTKRLSAPKEDQSSKKVLPFATSGNGVFVIPLLNNPKHEDEFSLFRNQKIEILYEAKQGEGTQTLPDFELAKNSNNTQNLQDVISPQIKFAVENTQTIKYDWNYDEYADNVLEYESSTPGTTETVSGFSKFKTPLKIKKIVGNKEEIITGKDGAESAANLEKMLKDDFKDQLQFSYTYIRKSGSESKYKNTANIYNELHLENGDRVILTIEAVANDLIYTEAPKPLILNVKGLMTDAPEQDKLQFLRVEQSGVINGKGSFRLLVNDPLKPNEDNQSILKNWKFLIRVWDGKTDEKGEHKIKINWTEDQTKLVNLSNGDKVEWKLVDKNDNHVQDGYYNTVAGEHQSGPNGQVIFNFMQVNYPNGPEDKVVVSPGIGAYPAKEDENKYPEKSGFVIGGLQEKLTRFDLTQSAFEKIIQTLGPYYKGVDGHGVLNFNPKFFEGTWWVNHNGDVYQKETNQPTTWTDQIMNQPAEITLDQFFAHTTFYTKNPAVVPTQIGWQFTSNDTALDNYLSNSNQLWARFDVMQPQANLEKSVHLKAPTSNDPAAFDGFLIAQLPAVANLKTVTDPMSPLWWVLISLGMLITFGTLFIIVWKQKYKKLKDPKI